MKKAACFVPMLLWAVASLPAETGRLGGFPELLAALESGRSVRAVIHYGRCRLVTDGKETKAPDAIGGMDLRTFEYFAAGSAGNAKAFIAASESVLISHPRFGVVRNSVKVRVFEDGAAEITARYLDPKSFKTVMDETFFGRIDGGRDGGAVCFFATDRGPDAP